jgi:hypothetical protein
MTKRIRFPLLVRLLLRAAEIAEEQGMAKEVTRVYSDVLAPVAVPFCKLHDAVVLAETTVTQKGIQVARSQDVFDPVYRGTRSVVLAFAPGTVLPDTLKVQPTDTDVLYGLATLVSIVKARAGEPWADELMEGQFGTVGAELEAALKESIAARKALAAARQQRVNAYGPAYDRYMAFKHVVRDVLGTSSVQYRRLHPRAAVPKEIEPAEEAAPESGVMPSTKAAPVPSSVKTA